MFVGSSDGTKWLREETIQRWAIESRGEQWFIFAYTSDVYVMNCCETKDEAIKWLHSLFAEVRKLQCS